MFEKHAEEIENYIESKFPDIPVYVAQDISVFATNRAIMISNDILKEYIKEEQKRLDRYYRRHKNAIDKVFGESTNNDSSN